MSSTVGYILRILIGALLGGAIGLEREYRAKEAGFRTHFLVALGSTLFTVISAYGFSAFTGLGYVSFDPSRIAAQIVTGIGFIGAGTIIFQKHVVRGLTTAAGLWVTAAIGIATGVGMYSLAIASTVMVLIGLEALNFLIHYFGMRNILVTFSAPSVEKIKEIINDVRAKGIKVSNYNIQSKKTEGSIIYFTSMDLRLKRKKYEQNIIYLMSCSENVTIDSE
jgi:putative Mg2+ transporter-C (MgtC) family protein